MQRWAQPHVSALVPVKEEIRTTERSTLVPLPTHGDAAGTPFTPKFTFNEQDRLDGLTEAPLPGSDLSGPNTLQSAPLGFGDHLPPHIDAQLTDVANALGGLLLGHDISLDDVLERWDALGRDLGGSPAELHALAQRAILRATGRIADDVRAQTHKLRLLNQLVIEIDAVRAAAQGALASTSATRPEHRIDHVAMRRPVPPRVDHRSTQWGPDGVARTRGELETYIAKLGKAATAARKRVHNTDAFVRGLLVRKRESLPTLARVSSLLAQRSHVVPGTP